MLKRKLHKAGFIIVSFIFVAIASGSKPPSKTPVINKPAYKAGHQFDSSGLCTCIPFTITTELSNAPRIQLNKNVAGFVKKYNKENGFFLTKAKVKVDNWFTAIDSMLVEYELPAELKYLAFIESGLKKITVSRSGAKGPWALMPVAAKEYGLTISKHNDERLDYYKSTQAAAALLSDLYKKYDDWLLVIAAYNSGPAWVQRAIKLSGSRNYWALQNFLPKETRSHVRRFIAVHYYFEGHGSLATMTKTETQAHIKAVEEFKIKQQELEKTDSATVVIAQ